MERRPSRPRTPIAILLGCAVLAACNTPAPTHVGASHAPSPQASAATKPSPGPSQTPSPGASATATPAATPTPAATATATPATTPSLQALVQAKLLNLAKVGFNQNRSQLASSGDEQKAGLLGNNSAGIIGNNGGSVLSDNGLGLVANNGGSLISDHGGGYRLLAAAPLPTLPPHVDIANTAKPGELLVQRRVMPDGVVTLLFGRAADEDSYRLVNLRADKPFHEEGDEVLERWPTTGKIKRKRQISSDEFGGGALAAHFELLSDLSPDGSAGHVAVQPGSYLKDQASGAGDLVDSFEADAGTHTGTFRYVYPALGMVETGTLEGVLPDHERGLYLPYWDPLGANDGVATAKLGETLLYTRTVKSAAGQRVTTFDLQDGYALSLARPGEAGARPVPALKQEGSLALDGKAIAKVVLEVSPEGSAVFTVTFDADPGKPLVVGYGSKGVPSIPPTPTPEPVIVTLAGLTGNGFADGLAPLARFQAITGLAPSRVNPAKLYVVDFGNNRVRAVDATTQVVSTVAGDGTAGTQDGPAATARFDTPRCVAVGPDDTLYIAERSNKVRVIAPDGTVSTLAGSGAKGSDDGTGAAATFNSLAGIALAPDGALYVADYYNAAVRRIGTMGADRGVVTTLANASSGLAGPLGVALGPDGALYVADTAGGRIRKIDLATKAVTTVVGTSAPERQGQDGAALDSGIGQPRAVLVDGQGRVVFADAYSVRRLEPDGQVRTLAGTGFVRQLDGPARAANFSAIDALALGADGSLLIGDGSQLRVKQP